MKNQSTIVFKNNPNCSGLVIHSGFIPMGQTFREYLREQMDKQGISSAELARRSGATPQNISRILTDKPHPLSGALPKVRPETVERFAKALNIPIDEARLAAGYAPHDSADLSLNIADDIRISLLHGKDYTEEDRAEFEIGLGAAYEALKARIDERKRRGAEAPRPMTADKDLDRIEPQHRRSKTG